jgi:hypothetical protein
MLAFLKRTFVVCLGLLLVFVFIWYQTIALRSRGIGRWKACRRA